MELYFTTTSMLVNTNKSTLSLNLGIEEDENVFISTLFPYKQSLLDDVLKHLGFP
jgi:hypothetical protein